MFRWVAFAALLAAALAGCRTASSSPARNATTQALRTATVAAQTASAGCSPARPHASGDSNGTLQSGGLERTYILHVPAGYDGSKPAPVVLVFHGFTLNADFMSAYAKIPQAADKDGFIALLPNGTGQPQYWNSSAAVGGPDDAGFIRDLLAKVQSDLCVDPTRIYAAGYSNGGGMAQFVACELEPQIAAVAVVASTYGSCQPTVPVVAFHGTADPLLPFDGSDTSLGVVGGNLPPVRKALSEWAAALGCDRLPTISRPGANVELSTFRHCITGDGEALLYAVLGGGHTWPGGAFPIDALGQTTNEIDATQIMWQFFAAHPKAHTAAPGLTPAG
ncbi:MAG TPA: PHB depolymerase family esterase [Dehalococcoidia bacterium]|nr:PHB depolymerase family esterase [Dehalococcoidia bacterium]